MNNADEVGLSTRDFVSAHPEMEGVKIMLNNGTEYPILKIAIPYVALFKMSRDYRSVFEELVTLCGVEDITLETQKSIIEITNPGLHLPPGKEADDQVAEFVIMIKDIIISGLRNGEFMNPAANQDREKLTLLAQDLVLSIIVQKFPEA